MLKRTTLSKLNHDDLSKCPAWAAVGNYLEDEDASLQPVNFDDNGQVSAEVEDVWCLCTICFADGSKHFGSAVCRGDWAQGPLMWTVYNGPQRVSLFVPPAPDFVLAKEGPTPFAAAFGKEVDEVFPMTITAVPRFAKEPHIRSVRIATTGIIP